jgi:GrpB-like predicted nucleotidyltransferase (UPF0157 family)
MEMFRLMYHSAQWSQEFEQTKSLLLWATEGWICDVVHIGSTALEDMIAQPTIDVIAGITSLSGLNEAAMLIEGLQYQRFPAPEWCDEELVAWFVRPWSGHPSHTVLVARFEGKIWQQCLQLKQQLIDQYLKRQELESLKRHHFEAQSSLETYQTAKHQFFQSLLAEET